MNNTDKCKKTDSILKAIILNIIGFASGILAGAIVGAITELILFNVIGRIPLIPQILSFPVSYEYYATIAVIGIQAFVSVYICSLICKFTNFNFNFSVLAICILLVIDKMLLFITTIQTEGFSFDVLFVIIAAIGTYIVICPNFLYKEKIKKGIDAYLE